MVFFCCKKPRFNQRPGSVIFVDVDGTLISSSDNKLNIALLEALRGKEVVLLTKMSMREVQEKATNPQWFTRQDLIKTLEDEYDIHVSLVITPVDLHTSLAPGDGYKKYIEPWTTQAQAPVEEGGGERMLTQPTYTAACAEFAQKVSQLPISQGTDPKGPLIKKFLAYYGDFTSAYILDDQEECIDSATTTCRALSMPLSTIKVNMRTATPATVIDYIENLNQDFSPPGEATALLSTAPRS